MRKITRLDTIRTNFWISAIVETEDAEHYGMFVNIVPVSAIMRGNGNAVKRGNMGSVHIKDNPAQSFEMLSEFAMRDDLERPETYDETAQTEGEKGMSEKNKALIRRFYDAWNEQKMDEVVSMIAPNFIDHAMPPEMAYGREGFLKARALGRKALADVHIQLEHVFAENDYVITHVIIHATHIGTYQSIPPTGKRFAMEAISIMRMENEQLVEHWECSDFAGVMKQLGATVILENGTPA